MGIRQEEHKTEQEVKRVKDIVNGLENNIFWEQTYNRLLDKQDNWHRYSKEELAEINKTFNNKQSIIKELESGTYKWGIPRKVELSKHQNSKKRVVYVYDMQDRFVLGVLYRVFSYCYNDELSAACFSYRKDIGTIDALHYIKEQRDKASEITQDSSKDYIGLKLDIHAYFNSVGKEKLHQDVDELFDRQQSINSLGSEVDIDRDIKLQGIKISIEAMLFNDIVNYNGQLIQEYKSLVPGSPFGSFLANWVLRELDLCFIDKTYARYSDDIIIIENSKDKIDKDLEIILEYIGDIGLTINPEKYQWFNCNDDIEFLGLKLCSNGDIDISDHAKHKIKKQIHRWTLKGRVEIEKRTKESNKNTSRLDKKDIEYKEFRRVAIKILRRINNKNFFCAVGSSNQFGWGLYSYPKITTTKTLYELDMHTKECIRSMRTGKHNRSNINAVSDDELKSMGYLSLVQMYNLYRADRDYFNEVLEINKSIKSY